MSSSMMPLPVARRRGRSARLSLAPLPVFFVVRAVLGPAEGRQLGVEGALELRQHDVLPVVAG